MARALRSLRDLARALKAAGFQELPGTRGHHRVWAAPAPNPGHRVIIRNAAGGRDADWAQIRDVRQAIDRYGIGGTEGPAKRRRIVRTTAQDDREDRTPPTPPAMPNAPAATTAPPAPLDAHNAPTTRPQPKPQPRIDEMIRPQLDPPDLKPKTGAPATHPVLAATLTDWIVGVLGLPIHVPAAALEPDPGVRYALIGQPRQQRHFPAAHWVATVPDLIGTRTDRRQSLCRAQMSAGEKMWQLFRADLKVVGGRAFGASRNAYRLAGWIPCDKPGWTAELVELDAPAIGPAPAPKTKRLEDAAFLAVLANGPLCVAGIAAALPGDRTQSGIRQRMRALLGRELVTRGSVGSGRGRRIWYGLPTHSMGAHIPADPAPPAPPPPVEVAPEPVEPPPEPVAPPPPVEVAPEPVEPPAGEDFAAEIRAFAAAMDTPIVRALLGRAPTFADARITLIRAGIEALRGNNGDFSGS